MKYVVREPITGVVICEGDADECAVALGYKSAKVFRNCAMKSRDGSFKKYIIETDDEKSETMDAIRRWDEFTEPLRRKYGIPRYKGD